MYTGIYDMVEISLVVGFFKVCHNISKLDTDALF